MSPLGHFALAFFMAEIVKSFFKTEYNLLWVWIVSLLPDIDFYIPFIRHRGPTHSVIVYLIIVFMILIVFKKGFIYLGALGSHLIGDYFTDYGCQLFWPVLPYLFKPDLSVMLTGREKYLVEFLLFFSMIFIIFVKKRILFIEVWRGMNH
jgi:membrane-bound metal-dependent hydrolase YbcI (DUF457 family)